ncbi:MAG: nucleotidyltransferase family protein [Dehalococcoidia bacterium]|nr:nucleotidyltransferase family protein [Dehalococcoidia bacterium]
MAGGGVVAVLLAAGESSRMGRLKSLLPWQDGTLIAYQVRCLLDAGAQQVIVVLGHQAESVRPHIPKLPGVRMVVNTRYHEGKTTSVKLGLAHVPADVEGVILLPVDQPRPAPLVAALVQTFREHRAPVTQPTFGGKRGHPIIFRADVLPELASITEETLGIKPVVDRYRTEAELVPVDSPVALVDLNTDEDYQDALELWKEYQPSTSPSAPPP